mgnify:CR=1 FL=1
MLSVMASVDVLNYTLTCLEGLPLPVRRSLTDRASVQSSLLLFLDFYSLHATVVLVLEALPTLSTLEVVLQLVVEPAIVHFLNCLVAVRTDCDDILGVVTATVVLRNDVVSLKDPLVVVTTDKTPIHLSTDLFL